ncbi:MAG: FkbM family methyltransferase [Tabrizicola sp.]|nr:FkbM family methyltransferase [Tabrizicola sp.]
MWSNYYGAQFGAENLFLVKDGDDWDLPSDGRFDNVIQTSFPRNRRQCDVFAADYLSKTCAELLSRYDVVLRTDVDEFLVVDPEKGTWDTVLEEVLENGYLYAFGLDVVHNDMVERSLDFQVPVLVQRRHAFAHGEYSKPCAISRPITWTKSCHSLTDGPVILSKALFLVHLASMDRHIFHDRISARGDLDMVSYVGHAGARERHFQTIRASNLYDLDSVEMAVRHRICFDDAGAPAMSPRFATIAMPDGAQYRKSLPVRLPDRFAELIPAKSRGSTVPASASEEPTANECKRLSLLRGLLRPVRRSIVADVGASPIEIPPYAFLLSQGACEVWGFEPQPEQFNRLVASAGPNEHYLPLTVGDGSVRRLYITQHPGFTSTLRPNGSTSKALNRWRKDIKIASEVEVTTTRLDDMADLPDFDLLKIDIQGGEADVFKHAERKLSTAVAVVTEAAAIPIYVDQPLLCDQMALLRDFGYGLHKFAFLRQVAFRTSLNTSLPRRGYGDQITDGDAIFVRSLLDLGAYQTEALKHLCILADFVFNSPSLALKALDHLILRGVAGRADAQYYADLLLAKLMAR